MRWNIFTSISVNQGNRIDYKDGGGERVIEGGGKVGLDVVYGTPIEVMTTAAAKVMAIVEGSIPSDPPAPLSVIEILYSVRRDWRKCMFSMCVG